MQKILVSSLLAVLLVPGTSAFAQFKSQPKVIRNWVNAQKMMGQAAKPSVVGRQIVRVPAGVIKDDKVALTHLAAVTKLNPVDKSLDSYIRRQAESWQMLTDSDVRKELLKMPRQWIAAGGKAFYEDQTQLAQDLDAFYQGNTDALIASNAREVKFYALPVDGILYKAPGYKTPVVLNSNDYFVIYDVAAKTGKIAENRHEIHSMFTPRMYDEIWKGMGSDKVFDDLNNLCDAIMLAHLHKERANKLRAMGVQANIVSVVKANKSIVQKQLNHQEELLAYLQQLPKVRQTEKGIKAYVVELPVEGLSWVESDGTRHTYNRQDHVMLFFELGAVGIYPRADVENPEMFKPVK